MRRGFRDRTTTSFDAVRLVAAFAVLVEHHFLVTGRHIPGIPGFGSVGFFAVVVFFSISGYFVAGSWARDPHMLRYWARRSLRIFPALLVVVAVSACVIGPVVSSLSPGDYFANPLTWSYWKNAALVFGIQQDLPGVFVDHPTSAVNVSLWTLPVELFMYACVSIIGFALKERGRFLYPLAVALLTVTWWVTPEFETFAMSQLFMLGICFFSGATVHAYRLLERVQPSTIGVVGLVVLVVAIGDRASMLPVAWMLFPIVALHLGSRASRMGAWVARSGDISYGVYLWAYPIQQLVVWMAEGTIGFVTSMLIAAAITTALAGLSMKFVEQPALRLRPRRSTDVVIDLRGELGVEAEPTQAPSGQAAAHEMYRPVDRSASQR